MSGFFQQAPPLTSFQKRFLDSILHKHDVLGSFAMRYPTVPLYSFAAMMSRGLSIMVCPDRHAIARQYRAFLNLGYHFPDVAVLDGTQMPHEEREIYEYVNRNQVHLLFTLPEKLATLNFLDMMVHADLTMLMVDQAHFLLSDFRGSYRYRKLQDGLTQLNDRPPIVLFAQPLSDKRQQALLKKIGDHNFTRYEEKPLYAKTNVAVQLLVTEHQKYKYVLNTIPIQQSGSVLIQVNDHQTAEKLGYSLHHAGYKRVLVCTTASTTEERTEMERQFHTHPDAIMVYQGYDTRGFLPPTNQAIQPPLKIIFWNSPPSVDDLCGQVFQANSENDPDVQVKILYTKEEYQYQLSRAQHAGDKSDAGHDHRDAHDFRKQRIEALKRYRGWVLSDSCRRLSLVAYIEGKDLENLDPETNPASILKPCGVCDRCKPGNMSIVKRLLKRWVY